MKKYKCVLKPSSSSSTAFAFISLLETKNTSHDVLQVLLRMSEAPNFHVCQLSYVGIALVICSVSNTYVVSMYIGR